MSTKITTPVLIDLPGETLTSENTEGVILPKGTTAERPGNFSVDFLVIAGGGGGGGNRGAGGGGAGGYRTSFGSGNISGGLQPVETTLSLSTNTSYNVTVGEGGSGVTGASANHGADGDDSIFDQITSTGGGGGGGGLSAQAPGDGGSGGGASNYAGNFYTGGTAVTPTQGFNAGDGNALGATVNQEGGVGGGGAGSASLAVSTLGVGTNGGSGLSSSITGSPVLRAGGGGGSSNLSSGSAGTGSDGGGNGRGKSEGTGNAQDGTANTGGGGGAHPNQTIGGSSGSGGSGVVILRYSDEYTIVETTSVLTFTTDSTSVANTKITTFTAGTSGIIQFTTSSAPQPSTGEFRYNTTDKLVEFYNGTTWKQIADEYIPGQPPKLEANQILWLDANSSLSWTGSGSTWFDLSANNYDATIVTTVPSTGSVNGATYLDLSSRADYFQIPSATHGGALSLKSGNVLTFLFWIRMSSIASGTSGLNTILYGNTTGTSTAQAAVRYYRPSTQGFNNFVYDTSRNADFNSGYVASVTTSDWFMYVIGYDFPNNQWSINRYQPGKTNYNVTSTTTVSPQYTTDTDINLMSDGGGVYGGYGYLGEIRAYDKIFTTSELDTKYDDQKGKYGIT